MKALAAVLLVLGGMFAGPGQAQDWIVFVPFERDFRVLFPGPPARSTEADGSVAFKAAFANIDYEIDYAVYRLPLGAPQITDPQTELARRLESRLGEDTRVRNVREDDGDPEWDRHLFRYGRVLSINRLVAYGGRYYELQVVLPRGAASVAMQTARDFFNSFQLSGVGLPAIGVTLVQRLEAWCQRRTNPFARAFCEYSVCLQPGSDVYPHCAALPGR